MCESGARNQVIGAQGVTLPLDQVVEVRILGSPANTKNEGVLHVKYALFVLFPHFMHGS